MWLCGIGRKVFDKNCDLQDNPGFCLKEKSIIVVRMVRLVTLMAAEMEMGSSVKTKMTHSNISSSHLKLILGVIQQLHCGHNNCVTVVLHNFIFSFTYIILHEMYNVCTIWMLYLLSILNLIH
jgi:hypothetical protein